MTDDSIFRALARAVANCLKRSGKPVPAMRPDIRVIDGVDGFDSLCGIETTLELEEELKLDLGDNIFIKEVDGRPRARTFKEVVDAILAIVKKGTP